MPAHGGSALRAAILNSRRLNNLRVAVASVTATVAQPLRLGPAVARQVAAHWKGRGRAAPPHRPRRCTSGRNQMSQLVAIVKSLRNEEGQDLLEYALLVALIALIAIGAVAAAGGAVNNIFQAIANALGNAA